MSQGGKDSGDLEPVYRYRISTNNQINLHDDLIDKFGYVEFGNSKVGWYFDTNCEQILISDDGLDHDDIEEIDSSTIEAGGATITNDVIERAPENFGKSGEDDAVELLLLMPDEIDGVSSPVLRVLSSSVVRAKILNK